MSLVEYFSNICKRTAAKRQIVFLAKFNGIWEIKKNRDMGYDGENERDMGYEEPCITSPLNIILFFLDVMIKYFKNTGTN